MHHTDGNLYALERHLAEQEAYDAAQPETMYCGSCDETISSEDWPEFIDTETCPNCEGVLCCSQSDYEPSETAQGLIPIPDAANDEKKDE